jgi:hypothetical protein
MSCDEVDSKRCRVSLFDFIALSVGIGIAIGLTHIADWKDQDTSVTVKSVMLYYMGLFVLFCTFGAFFGKGFLGTNRGALHGCLLACLQFLVFLLIQSIIFR